MTDRTPADGVAPRPLDAAAGGVRAVVVPPLRLDPRQEERLGGLGLSVADVDDRGPAGPDGAAPPDLAAAIALGARLGAVLTVAGRGREPLGRRRDGVPRLDAALLAAAGVAARTPLALVLLPATATPGPGPVVVLSPAGAASSYELYVGAALAAAARRRVEHLNGRGAAGSAAHGGLPARAAARASAPGWRERAEPRPERALRVLPSRPAVVVVPVPPGSAGAPAVVEDHPDADVVLVFDAVHARHGAAVAQQVGSVVEMALGVELSLPGGGAPPARGPRTVPVPPARAAPGGPPAIRASDVVHVRLTDTALELTNRTRHRVRLRATLGSASDPDRARAVFEATLEPGGSRSAPTRSVAALAGLDPPVPVLRHWSHTSAAVYEGGDRRIVRVETAVLDTAGGVRAVRTDDAPNGLDFAVTARDLAALVGQGAGAALPEPAPVRTAPRLGRDLFAAFASALAVGAAVLGRTAS
ncbi:MAG TPA: hypothetical protein VF667_02605 [Pseudonocardia sp.]